MKKRIISIMIIAVTILTNIFSLVGCNKQEISTLTVGQWLSMVDYAFGMESYTSDEPYFSNVSSDNPYFAAVQIAAEWDVIDKEGSIDVDKKLTYKDALITLVNVGNFTKADASDDEKIKYAIDNFDSVIRTYWMNRNISQEDAVILLAIAQNKWETRKYTESIEEITYNDKVVDLSDVDLTESAISEMTLVVGDDVSVEEGSICILPSAENKFEKEYLKVESVSQVGGEKVVKFSDEELELEDIYEEIYIQETLVPTAENTVIYDGNGNIVSAGGDTSVQKDDAYNKDSITTLSSIVTTSQSIIPCASIKNKYEFKIDGYKVTLSYNLDGELDLAAEIECPNMLDKASEVKGHKMQAIGSIEVSDLAVSQKFDWGKEWVGFVPVPTLDSAELKIDYTVKKKLGISYTGKAEYVAAPAYSNGNGKFLTNLKRSLFKEKDGSGDVYGAETIASKKTIKICSLNVYSAGVAKICLDVSVTIKVNGSVEVTITENGSKGVEYKNGNLRFIKSNTKSYDLQAKAKLEGTIGFGPGLYIVGLKKQLVGLEAKIGAGVTIALKAHLADSEMHKFEELDFSDIMPEQLSLYKSVYSSINADGVKLQATVEKMIGDYYSEKDANVKMYFEPNRIYNLHVDFCTDINAYWLISIGITDDSYVKNFLGSKVKLEISICNEKNATFMNMHIDNMNWDTLSVNWGSNALSNNCTLKYIEFEKELEYIEDNKDDNTDEDFSDTEIEFGEMLILSTMNVNMGVGQSCLINITQLPQGYKKEDIIFLSKNEKVAKVDKQGNISAVGTGNTIIYAKTSDGKYVSMIAVIVSSPVKIEFEELI